MSLSLSESLKEVFQAERKLSFYDFSGLQSSLSFSEFGTQASSYQQALENLGVRPGVVVAVMGPTSQELVRACAAVWLAGATLCVLPVPTRLANLEQFLMQSMEKLSRSGAALLVGEEGAVSCFKEMAGLPVMSWEEVETFQGGMSLQNAPFSNHQPALVQFSSGTTRDPQPILLSEQALLSNSHAVLDRFPSPAGEHSCVSWLPLYHDMGLIGCFLMPLLAPGDLTLMGPEVFAVRPLTWLEAISQQRATTSSAPNFALAHCAERISDDDVQTLDLSCWEIAMVGAEAVRPATLRKFARKFAPAGFSENAFSPVYGLAEATLAVTFSPLGKGLKTLAYCAETLAKEKRFTEGESETPSLGQPLDGVSVEIREGGEVLPEGRLGEVWVKSRSLLTGIWQDELKTPLQEGWLDTQDAGFLKDGELYLFGRRRDILLLDGRNHDPDTLEEAAESIDVLRRCCAFCLECEEQDRDRLVLVCEVSKSWEGDLIGLQDLVKTTCRKSVNLVPDEILFIPAGELPVTSSGKLRRGKACDMYAGSEFLDLSLATA